MDKTSSGETTWIYYFFLFYSTFSHQGLGKKNTSKNNSGRDIIQKTKLFLSLCPRRDEATRVTSAHQTKYMRYERFETSKRLCNRRSTDGFSAEYDGDVSEPDGR